MSQFRNRRHIDLILLPLFVLQFSLPLSAIRKDVSLQLKHHCRTTVQGRMALQVIALVVMVPPEGDWRKGESMLLCLLDETRNTPHSMSSCILGKKIRKAFSRQGLFNFVISTELSGNVHIGHVCDAFSVDPLSRCCPGEGDQFSCQGCNLVSQCCNSYEFCVSCCLNPVMTPKELALKVKIAKPLSAGKYGSVFDFCAGRCRHSSESVSHHPSNRIACYTFVSDLVHENAYLSEFHHCFSIPSNSSDFYLLHPLIVFLVSLLSFTAEKSGPLNTWFKLEAIEILELKYVERGNILLGPSSTQLEARLAGINIIIGRQGESCDSVCKSSGQSCVPNKLALLNQCEVHTLVLILINFKLINLFADIVLI
ncbi:hypothetical protein Sango_0777000 [Sesamum angolense]|uniref:SREBP regulating gene protein n=1 Tax=Sesamum angolense TaxID=2727404 RepID=A0AAE1X3L8_9LAMI|nr:hypothetical protein Sango_0777000 [Sesamum angolense]